MNFIKMHGTGNDFVVLDAQRDDAGWPALARATCDRHFGIGSDGMIVALPSAAADLRMRMFNPDGSEAEMCGNGIRCLAKHAVESGRAAPRGGAITIETLAGVLRCEIEEHGGRIERVRVAMGRPRFQPAEIPVLTSASVPVPVQGYPVAIDAQRYAVTCVSLGNPHAVHFTDLPLAAFPLHEVGPRVEHHAAFPRRVNFEIVKVIERGRVEARVWERGAGETLACGTGACAIGVAARLAGLSDAVTRVCLPGGELRIEWDGAGEVYLSGPAVEVFRGEWLSQAAREPLIAAPGRA